MSTLLTHPLRAQRRRVVALVVAALAALGVSGALAAGPAGAATLSCWTKGAYLNVGQLGTWNNTFSHKVVCNLPTTVQAKLTRFNYATGAYTVPRDYISTANTSPAPGNFVNSGYATAPLFCTSAYLVTVTASAPGAGTITFDSGWRRYC